MNERNLFKVLLAACIVTLLMSCTTPLGELDEEDVTCTPYFDGVELSWPAVANADSYIIDGEITVTSPKVFIPVTYSVSEKSAPAEHHYRIVPCKEGKEGKSVTVTATPWNSVGTAYTSGITYEVSGNKLTFKNFEFPLSKNATATYKFFHCSTELGTFEEGPFEFELQPGNTYMEDTFSVTVNVDYKLRNGNSENLNHKYTIPTEKITGSLLDSVENVTVTAGRTYINVTYDKFTEEQLELMGISASDIRYNVGIYNSETGAKIAHLRQTAEPSYKFTNLNPGTEYTINVKAAHKDNYNYSAYTTDMVTKYVTTKAPIAATSVPVVTEEAVSEKYKTKLNVTYNKSKSDSEGEPLKYGVICYMFSSALSSTDTNTAKTWAECEGSLSLNKNKGNTYYVKTYVYSDEEPDYVVLSEPCVFNSEKFDDTDCYRAIKDEEGNFASVNASDMSYDSENNKYTWFVTSPIETIAYGLNGGGTFKINIDSDFVNNGLSYHYLYYVNKYSYKGTADSAKIKFTNASGKEKIYSLTEAFTSEIIDPDPDNKGYKRNISCLTSVINTDGTVDFKPGDGIGQLISDNYIYNNALYIYLAGFSDSRKYVGFCIY